MKASTLCFSIDKSLVVGLGAGLSRDIFCVNGTTIRVGVKKEERLEVTFDTFANHIFPLGANLQRNTKGKVVKNQNTCRFNHIMHRKDVPEPLEW